MSELGAFCYRDGRIAELLEEHLREVSIHVYLLVATKRPYVRFIGVLSGLFHDVGKALNVYQCCLLYDNKTRACKYTGHEVFSALLASSMLKPDGISEGIAADMAKTLGCSESDAKRSVVRVLTLAVLYHHQAMGDFWERLDAFLNGVRSFGVSSISVDRRIAGVVERVLEDVMSNLGLSHLSVDIDSKGVSEAEKVINEAIRARSINIIADDLGSKLRTTPEGLERKLLLLSKFITGCLIASDIYVAGLKRGGGDRPLHQHLSKMYKFLYKRTYLASLT